MNVLLLIHLVIYLFLYLTAMEEWELDSIQEEVGR